MPEDASYNTGETRSVEPTRTPFPWERFLWSVVFGFLGWFAFVGTVFVAIVFWVLVAVSREPHPEFKRFVAACARYVWQCLQYITMLSDEKPFPLGPLPRE